MIILCPSELISETVGAFNELSLKDTIHGKYDGTVEADGDSLVVDGQTLSWTAETLCTPFLIFIFCFIMLCGIRSLSFIFGGQWPTVEDCFVPYP